MWRLWLPLVKTKQEIQLGAFVNDRTGSALRRLTDNQHLYWRLILDAFLVELRKNRNY